jgi:hypothetical protein
MKPKINIPIISTPDVPLLSTTQDHMPISDITDDLIIYKDGGTAMILETTSLNFGLLSDNEQEAVIAAYAALLNSLSFSIQIVVRSQIKDISNYLAYLDECYKKITNPKMKILMESYQNFIKETVKKKNVLGKRFFIVLWFSPLELGIAKSFSATFAKTKVLPFTKSYVIKKSKIALIPRRDHLVRQAGRLGLRLQQLKTSELTELLYEVYNPVVQKSKAESGETEENESI